MNRKCAWGTWAIAGSTAAIVRMTSASTLAGRSGPPCSRGTVMASSPLASRAASSATGTAPDRSRSITPGAIEAAYSRAAVTASAAEAIAGASADGRAHPATESTRSSSDRPSSGSGTAARSSPAATSSSRTIGSTVRPNRSTSSW